MSVWGFTHTPYVSVVFFFPASLFPFFPFSFVKESVNTVHVYDAFEN